MEEAQRAIRAAAIEAKSGYKGVGIVKLMGRQSGFIATYASIASGEVDICLIPEVGSRTPPAGAIARPRTPPARGGPFPSVRRCRL